MAVPVWLGLIGVAVCAPIPEARGLFVAIAIATTAGTVWLWKRNQLTTSHVLVGAIVARIAFLPLTPGLTDDTFRYIWDGWLQLEGINPYRFVPSDAVKSADVGGWLAQNDLVERLNSPSFYSVYPPISQMVFAAGAWVDSIFGGPGSWKQSFYTIKILFATLEVGALLLLSRLVTARRLILYAWSPLVVLETAGQGHTEAALVFFLVAAVWAVRTSRPAIASCAVVGATLVKLYPVFLFPLLLRRFGWKRLVPGVAVGSVLCAPYVAWYVLPNVMSSLDLYVQLFEFFAGPYLGAKQILLNLTGIDYSKTLGPIFSTLFLATLPVIYAVDARRHLDFRTAALWILGGFLVFSTTVHPWYLLAVLPLVVFDRTGAQRGVMPVWGWIWLSAAALGTYTFYVGGPYWVWVVAGWSGAAGLWIWQAKADISSIFDHLLQSLQIRRAAAKANRVRPWLSAGDGSHHGGRWKLLDLGAGEGYVGRILQRGDMIRSGESGIPWDVQLCDVIDLNRTELPHDTYDGVRLPYEENAFDATILYFVLHHCEHAEAVLREALRVTSGRVIVVESVVTNPVQHRFLEAADRFVNRLRSNGEMTLQEEHLSFRSTDEWKNVARRCGASVEHCETSTGIVHPQALLVLEPMEEGLPVA
ncbi:hypothetical protein CRI94_01970 [Longibacter salinarum]|uniref:Methyltransferase type 11 domain-containing protein n=1 Tax=Longibacter salinarum TaxID=1850348 RepID=A0A2A8D358_9BACT|nr:hypothetical protein CRI94_01970 [Longibacter salinarum]